MLCDEGKSGHESRFRSGIRVEDGWPTTMQFGFTLSPTFTPSPSPLYPLSAARGRKIWPALHGGEEGREGNRTLLSGNLYRIQPCDRYVESFFSEGRGQVGRAIAFYYGP